MTPEEVCGVGTTLPPPRAPAPLLSPSWAGQSISQSRGRRTCCQANGDGHAARPGLQKSGVRHRPGRSSTPLLMDFRLASWDLSFPDCTHESDWRMPWGMSAPWSLSLSAAWPSPAIGRSPSSPPPPARLLHAKGAGPHVSPQGLSPNGQHSSSLSPQSMDGRPGQGPF